MRDTALVMALIGILVGDEKLAGNLRKAKDRIQALAAVSLRIAFLKNRTTITTGR